MNDIDRVAEIARVHADASESARRLTPEVVDALREAGFFRMCVPKSLGGMELGPPAVLASIERVAVADGAAGWCAMIAATSSSVAGHLQAPAAKEVFGTADRAVVGPFAPIGRGRREGDSYVVNGRWPYTSMCLESSWIMAGTVVDDGDRRLMFIPADQLRVHDTWHTLGMRATGSHDVEAIDVVVPVTRSVPLTFDSPYEPGPLYAFPVLALLASGIASVCLGVARGALDYLVELAGRKTPTYSVRRLGERSAVQSAVAEAESAARAARAWLFEAVNEAWEQARERGRVDLDARLNLRMAATHATTSAARAVTDMFRLGGGSSVYLDNPGQRRLRDIHSATQHVMVGRDVLDVAGRHLLGLRIDIRQL